MQNKNLLIGLVLIAAVVGFFGGSLWTENKILREKNLNNGQVQGAVEETVDNTPQQITGPEAITPTATGVTTFQEKKDAQICTEDGKPVVYLFSTTWCPHCEWIKETFDSVATEYVNAGKIKAYHWEIDTGDDTLTAAVETGANPDHLQIYNQFNPAGSIPTFVLGCKYFRVGNGYEAANDLSAEEAEFRAAIDDLLK